MSFNQAAQGAQKINEAYLTAVIEMATLGSAIKALGRINLDPELSVAPENQNCARLSIQHFTHGHPLALCIDLERTNDQATPYETYFKISARNENNTKTPVKYLELREALKEMFGLEKADAIIDYAGNLARNTFMQKLFRKHVKDLLAHVESGSKKSSLSFSFDGPRYWQTTTLPQWMFDEPGQTR